MQKARFVTSKKTKNFEYCLVQFETVDDAKAALKNEKHSILNANVKVKAAHDRIQPDSKEYVDYEQADEDAIWELCHGNGSDIDSDDDKAIDQAVEDFCDFYNDPLLGHEPDYVDFDDNPDKYINWAQANYDSDCDDSW